jgi:peptidylprolyl isomerase
MSAVAVGDQVRIHYTARFADGTIFASSKDTGPLEFVAGGTQVVEGVSQAVIGMRQGESKVVDVPPELGFGARDAELEQRVALADLSESVQVGDQLDVHSGERTLRVWVREITDEHAIFDGNHPLAGHHLIYEIAMVSFVPQGPHGPEGSQGPDR